jgi:hypothetical protein
LRRSSSIDYELFSAFAGIGNDGAKDAFVFSVHLHNGLAEMRQHEIEPTSAGLTHRRQATT